MIVLASTHARAITERDEARNTAEIWQEEAISRAHTIADLRARVASVTAQLDARDRIIEAQADALLTAEARLAPFVSRQRGQGGRFVGKAA